MLQNDQHRATEWNMWKGPNTTNLPSSDATLTLDNSLKCPRYTSTILPGVISEVIGVSLEMHTCLVHCLSVRILMVLWLLCLLLIV
jgi:hypothetical protein